MMDNNNNNNNNNNVQKSNNATGANHNETGLVGSEMSPSMTTTTTTTTSAGAIINTNNNTSATNEMGAQQQQQINTTTTSTTTEATAAGVVSSNHSSNNGSNNSSSSGNSSNTNTNINTEKKEEWQLRIISQESKVEIRVQSHSSVGQVKQQVKQALECSPERYLRLICKGRLLAPDSAPLYEFSVKDNDALHAVLAATTTSSSTTSTVSGPSESTRRRRRGIVVGRGGRVTRANNNNTNDDDDSSSSDDEEQGMGRRGFDRLRSSGMTRQEITVIRAYFSRHVDRYVQSHPNDHEDVTDLRLRRWMMEEDWMSIQGPASEFRLNLNQNALLRFPSSGVGGGSGSGSGGVVMDAQHWRASLGTDRDFMWGFVLGFFVGFVLLIWVWMPTVPHKQKIGILAGISFQLALNVLQQDHDEYEFDSGD